MSVVVSQSGTIDRGYPACRQTLLVKINIPIPPLHAANVVILSFSVFCILATKRTIFFPVYLEKTRKNRVTNSATNGEIGIFPAFYRGFIHNLDIFVCQHSRAKHFHSCKNTIILPLIIQLLPVLNILAKTLLTTDTTYQNGRTLNVTFLTLATVETIR